MDDTLKGIGIGGYRAFSEEQRIRLDQKVTLLAGPNNSGKSCVLDFVNSMLPTIYQIWGTDTAVEIDPLDLHLGGGPLTVGLAYSPEAFTASATERQAKEPLESVLKAISADDGHIWLSAERGAGGAFSFGANLTDHLTDCARQIARFIYIQTGTRHGSPERSIREFITRYLNPKRLQLSIPDVVIVPAFRRVGSSDPEAWSGRQIIDRLATFQNPRHDRQEDRAKFNKLNRFLAQILGDADAKLEVPHDRETLVVHLDGRSLPLESLGTGVHEVVILGAAAVIETDSLLAIEEPEIHLHPMLQRKLIRFLSTSTDGQYLITTHSAHLLDAPEAAVIAVRQSAGTTVTSEVLSAHERFGVCWELGYRASDLMQANFVIWVEGPSDRLYLRHWLTAADDDLTEGLHYSIMFYGGRLLSHLSPTDPEVDDFISLRRINRNVTVLMDSDRASSEASLNATKQRVVDELAGSPGLAWVTAGREIENYVDRQLLERASGSLGLGPTRGSNRYHKRYPDGTDKVQLAKAVASHPAELDVLDLEERIHELVGLIASANHLETPATDR